MRSVHPLPAAGEGRRGAQLGRRSRPWRHVPGTGSTSASRGCVCPCMSEQACVSARARAHTSARACKQGARLHPLTLECDCASTWECVRAHRQQGERASTCTVRTRECERARVCTRVSARECERACPHTWMRACVCVCVCVCVNERHSALATPLRSLVLGHRVGQDAGVSSQGPGGGGSLPGGHATRPFFKSWA